MKKNMVQDITRSLTRGARGDVLRAAEPCWLLLQPGGEPWDETEAPQLSHSHFLSTCILGAKDGQNMLRMSE